MTERCKPRKKDTPLREYGTAQNRKRASSQLRPRVSTKELEFIEYSLQVLELLAKDKFEEIHNLRSDLKRFARIVWFTGDVRAFRLYTPFSQYALAELPKGMDMVKLSLDAQRLRRRIRGLLKGRRYHARTLHSLGNGTKDS